MSGFQNFFPFDFQNFFQGYNVDHLNNPENVQNFSPSVYPKSRPSKDNSYINLSTESLNQPTTTDFKPFQIPKSEVDTQFNIVDKKVDMNINQEDINSYAEKEKNEGNSFFKQNQFENAIEHYTNAINLRPDQPAYYTNRALAHKKLGKIYESLYDSIRALEIDSNNLKGHLMSAECLCEISKIEFNISYIDQGVIHFSQALIIARNLKDIGTEDRCASNIKKAEKLKNLMINKIEESEKVELLAYLKDLIDHDTENTRKNETYDEINASLCISSEKNLPDPYVCKITFDLINEAVTTEAGVTYENYALQEHFKKGGAFDPVTRDKLTKKYLLYNINLDQAISHFRKINPWSYDCYGQNNFESIKFLQT